MKLLNGKLDNVELILFTIMCIATAIVFYLIIQNPNYDRVYVIIPMAIYTIIFQVRRYIKEKGK